MVPSILLSTIALAVILGASSFAAEVVTDSTVYDLGSTVGIDGFTFSSGEIVTLQVTEPDGTPITGDAGLPWEVASDGTGEFGTSWLLDYQGTSDELLVTAVGQSSGLVATTSFAPGATNLDQLQNGTETTPPQWANGNINSSNSCYSEGRAVPYRGFINAELGEDSTHFFTIEMDWTKATIHAFDFLASYDLSEDSAISLAGGPCGNSGTSAPEDCVEPTDSLVLPNPIDSFNYSGSIPPDFYTLVNGSFQYNGPHYLMAYNAVIDSVEKYLFGGSSSSRTWSVVVHYTQVDTGTVGFYWGGHMAQGDPDHWGYGNGAASVSGAPYHMRMKSFDGGGGAGQDRSIQNGTICLPPVATILIDTDSLCYDFDTTYIAYDTSDANDWLWHVTGGTIIGDSTLSSVEFSVDSGASTVTIELVACNADGGCPGDYCCTDISITLPTASCNHPPEVYCPPDDSLFVCDLSEICVTGFTSYDADGDALNCEVSPGSLDGDSVCFTPVEGDNTITYICTDPWGAADTCETTIHVTLNSDPTASCPASDTLFVCDLSDICLDGFGCDDPDGNVVSSTINGVPFGGGQYCFTPVEGDNYLQLICVDACGEADTCETTINVTLNSGPTASCPPSGTMFVCDLSDICIGGFTTSDPDNNIATVTATGGTLSGDTVCFTPSVGSNTITLIVTDDCGEADTCQTTITVGLNSPPVASCPGDVDTTFVCDLSDICIDGFTTSDPDNNITSVVVSGGTLSGDTVCFTPSVGANTITLIVTDSCGEADTCQATVTVTLNSAPVASCPGDDSLFVCILSDICIDGFTTSDLDGNIASVVVTGGTLSGDTVCFTPSVGSNTITLIVTDDCGEADTCQTVITVGLNSPPVADAGPDQSLFLAEPTEICWPASCSDVDGNLTGCALVEGPGIYDDTNICFTTDTPGVYVFVLEATDDCAAGRPTGYTDSDTAVITVTYNSPPVTTCPGDTSIFLCNLSDICLDGFGCDDPDDNVVSSTINGVPFGGGQYCFTPVEGDNYLQLICVDACGVADTCETLIHVDLNQGPTASCPPSDTLAVCDLSEICVSGFGCDDPDDNVVSSTINGVPFGGGQYCFTPVEGNNYLQLICVDYCGLADTCETLIHVDLNQGPTASCPASDTLAVCDLSDICLDGFGCDDPDGNVVSSTINGVPFGGGQYCFTPVEGDNYLQLICVDYCGLADTCETLIHVDLNQGPTASCPPSDALFVCDLSDICLDGFGCDDPDGNVVSSTINGVPFGGGQYCFTPVEGDNYLQLICVDYCGLADTCETLIHVDLNQGPTASCPPNDALFVCDLSTICLDGFGCDDPDDNVVSSTINGVPFAGGHHCFLPIEGDNYLQLICVDACGEADTCETTISVTLNSGPTASCPPSDALFVCDLSDICLDGFGCNDPDDNVVSSTINGVPFGGGQYCFTPVEGDNYLQLICVDSCGAADTCQTLVHVELNSPPEVTCPDDVHIVTCYIDDIVCVENFGATDPNGNLASITINGQPYTLGTPYCFAPDSGVNELIFVATDSCNASAACTTTVNVEAEDPEVCNDCPIVTIEKTHDTHQGQHELVTVTIDSTNVLMGGFEILIAYDAAALALVEAIPGPPFYDPEPDGCGWEYFDYRFGPFGNCGSACPSGMVRVVGLAEINNGPNHADCFLPDPQPATVFTLDFLVTNDRTFECQYVPIYFYWTDCTDNTMSDYTGNILYIDQVIYDFEGNLIWDEDDDDLFPEDARPTGVGAPDYCLNPDPDKPTAIRCLDFINGGIDIVCADSIDDRGDMNLNGSPNEIADAVLFINYFVEGLSVFNVNTAGQIAASDVNADGITLSVADLVYLIRIVVGDALPYAKLAPIVVEADLAGGVLSVGVPLGAVWVALQGEHRPELLAAGLEMKYRYDANADLTRILVYSLQKDRTFEGAFLAGLGGELVAFEAATYQGTSVTARLVPDQFALHQCYPNPFNPVTTISFSLAEAADYELTIYNTLGREVQSFTGHAQPGVVEIQWNASGHASGIYFYRLTAGDFTDTKKMVLLK